ncbi:hypothetical protein BJX63DRAFT_386336 [Aspergillus granulosus]|uniref:Rhodopsin domain-containing protein n=1 Tax=Aspergillus granulosus TaxID=176169 RepID=A0ABR4HNY4_9EURO
MSPEAFDQLMAAPALAAPAGITPNFDNPPNRNGLAWVVTTLCMVIATMCLLLRLFFRSWVEKKFRIEEALMIGAYGAYWGTAYAGYSLIYTPGYCVHTWNLRNRDLTKPLYLIHIYGNAYTMVLVLIKTAILTDWYRIFVSGNRIRTLFWWGCWGLIIFQNVWALICMLLLNLQCRPYEAIWKFWIPSKCYPLPIVMLTSASVQVVTDISMFLLPQKIIWSLHMTWRKKVGVSVIFGVGILASIAATFRLVHTVQFATEPDSMYLIGPLIWWACAETTCGFFIFSVPCLSKIIVESGLPRWTMSALTFSAKSSNPSNQNSNSGPRYRPHSLSQSKPKPKHWLDTNANYSVIGEGGIPMKTTGRPESQTNAHDGPQAYYPQAALQITPPVDICVSHDSLSHPGSEQHNNALSV